MGRHLEGRGTGSVDRSGGEMERQGREACGGVQAVLQEVLRGGDGVGAGQGRAGASRPL